MKQEPTISVGLVENAGLVTVRLLDNFTDNNGRSITPGEYHVTCSGGKLSWAGECTNDGVQLSLSGATKGSRFRIQVTIGIDFHWQQKQMQTFSGGLRFLPCPGDKVTVVNEVPLETYILSVSCSEMSANSPEEFLKAHSIISRSWLLAQLESKQSRSSVVSVQPANDDEFIRWYDRESHKYFDVCADDHCQRYQGTDMISSGQVSRAIEATRGIALMYDGKPCDARFSKCCGGVTEDFRLAWSNTAYPYLVPLFDGPSGEMPSPPLSGEDAARGFFTSSPDVYCNCADEKILGRVLNNYDRATNDFFRWRVRLTPDEIAGFLDKKLHLQIGKVIALEPVKRGLSGRLERLRFRGDKATVTIGKELEIRRALSPTHLYSSAFVIDTEGPKEHPDAFILTGGGWGHGVGLCQIGAAVMACRGAGFSEILKHYYPGSTLEHLYK